MWGRVIEIMTAVWLAASPFIFGSQSDAVILWSDFWTAMLICGLSGFSYWQPTRHAHYLNLLVGAGLAVWGRFYEMPPTPVHQNHIVIGLFLLMIALIPNQASKPPSAWRTT